MSKIVVLAEKPSVARDIARVLRCQKKGNGFLEGDKYIVTWALGHLVTHADPESYGDQYKSWRMDDLPMIFSNLKLVVIKQTSKQYHAVKAQLNRKDVKEIIIATDAGREGELVARWIIEKAHVNKPIKRLWISSVTDKAIKDGFNKLKNGKEYENLYASAVARAEADWFVGINATRALTTKFNAQLSCGRVQTPTLAMIAHREEEIRNFKPRTFYGITAVTDKGVKLVWQDSKSKEMRTFDGKKSEQLVSELQHKSGKITDVHKAYKKSYAPQLYDLTELQRDAHKIFGYSAKETLSIMQRLYEQHKVLTYPRTDSRYLSSDLVDSLKDRVKACSVGPYTLLAAKALKQPLKANKSFVDDSKVSDHHAIIPTEEKAALMSLSDKERKIYDLVVKRFLAVLYPPFEYEQTTITAKIGQETFLAKGKRVIAQGWKEVYDHRVDEDDQADDMKEQTLPKLEQGDQLQIRSVSQTKGETKPPAPFNEGTLLSAMENPQKFITISDQKLKQTLGQAGGIGTVATRADIIDKLLNSFAIEQKGKDLVLTSKGKQLLDLAPQELKSPILTAEWEQKLMAISQGKLQKQQFIGEIKNYTRQIVSEIKNSQKQYKHDNITGTKCPECGKLLLEVNGKKGKMLVCQDRECGHRKSVSIKTKARCPQCRKSLELHGEGEGQIFVCRCGYKEKHSAFQERRKKEKHKNISKKDVTQYLRQQDKKNQEPINTALADALAKLKLDKE
ncbi:DNA topoisomerase III [Bacillus horti]|uniref:DNA topoisomerase 3 n=1 Tax=Caldalkalibacillus horti TaxID=77523 RepID=A0ABT9VY60_9BACI|nr:DNA topoisomerase III [Bacillus horti]MDQ0165912.1 DNA topoisomerase-3 [Bacillus horti]